MDANSIITQVSRDDEQLNAFTNEKGIYTKHKFTISITYIGVFNEILQIGFLNRGKKNKKKC